MQNTVNIHQLKSLLQAIATGQKGVSIRLNMIGEPTPTYFAEVLVYTNHALLLVHMPTRTVLNVPDLSQVTSFSLNRAFANFSAFQEYIVTQADPLKLSADGPFHEEYTF